MQNKRNTCIHENLIYQLNNTVYNDKQVSNTLLFYFKCKTIYK